MSSYRPKKTTGFFRRTLAVLLTFSLTFPALPAFAANNDSVNATKTSIKSMPYVEGCAIVRYRNPTFGKNMRLSKVITNETTSRSLGSNIGVVTSDTLSTKELLDELSKNNNVIYAEPDYIIKASSLGDYATHEQYWSMQWGMQNNGTIGDGEKGVDMNLLPVWEKTTGKGVVVAVMDTGIDASHPDLVKNLWSNTTKLPGKYGFDFVNGDSVPEDEFMHGTHVAGIIAAAMNGTGTVGVAPDSKIMALRVLDQNGSGKLSNVIDAFSYMINAKNMGVNVVAANLSLGWENHNMYSLNDFITLAGEYGILSVVSSGNEFSDIDKVDTYPATFDNEYIISVGACTPSGQKAAFSNYGKRNVDVFAPGTYILSGTPFKEYVPGVTKNGERYLYDFEDKYAEITITAGIETNDTGEGEEPSEDSEEDPVGNTILSKDSGESEEPSENPYEGEEDTEEPEEGDGDVEEPAQPDIPLPTIERSTKYSLNGEASLKVDIDVSEGVYYTLLLSDIKTDPRGNIGFNFRTPSKIDAFSINISYFDTSIGEYRTIESYDAFEDMWIARTTSLSGCPYGADVRMEIVPEEETEHIELYIDDVGVGVSNEKYSMQQGTSMAAPFVAGEVALIASLFPNASAEEIRSRILGGVVVDNRLKDFCVTSGRVDVVKAVLDPLPTPLSSTKITGGYEISGSFFGKKQGTVKINEVAAKVISWTDTSIKVETKNTLDGFYRVAVTRPNSAGVKVQGSGILEFENSKNRWEMLPQRPGKVVNSTVTSDGKMLYSIHDPSISEARENNSLWNKNYKYDPKTQLWSEMADMPLTAEYTYSVEDAVCDGKKIYVPVIIESTAEVTNEETGEPDTLDNSRIVIYEYDIAKDTWKDMNAPYSSEAYPFIGVPSLLANFSTVLYNGYIIIAGGENIEGVNTKEVWAYSISKNDWRVLPYMREERTSPVLKSVGGKLIALGGWSNAEGEDRFTKKLYTSEIFNGKKWVKGPDVPYAMTKHDSPSAIIGSKLLVMSSGGWQTALDKTGGYLDLKTGKWTSLPYRVSLYDYKSFSGAVIGKYLYAVGGFSKSKENGTLCRIRIA